MSGNEIRDRYFKYMAARGHAIVPSAALVPENDPTTLFTGSGMQPMLPYLLGETHPKGTRIADSQKSFRAEDIEEIGDNRHTTFFEMLGNWSFGDYFKQEQIEWMFDFLVNDIKLDPKRLYISVFGGDADFNLPKDTEAPAMWQKLFAGVGIEAGLADIGSEAAGYERGIRPGERIFYYEAKKNWWSRAGVPAMMPIGEPGGPDSEMFYDFGTVHDQKFGAYCHPNCDCGRFMEIGNNVFMQYVKTGEREFTELKNKNIDFGGGLERIAAAVNNEPDVFKVDLLWNTIAQIEKLANQKYENNRKAFRIITDHIRGAVFMIGDNVLPANSEQGYFVRRLLRRAVRFADELGIKPGTFPQLAQSVIDSFKVQYPNLEAKRTEIVAAIALEEEQFRKTLEAGLKQFNKVSLQVHLTSTEEGGKKVIDKSVAPVAKKFITAEKAFDLYTTYGFPIELTLEIAGEKGFEVDIGGFEILMKDHRDKSRAGAEQKFKGGLADSSEKVVELHTATHLMLAGLQRELGAHIHQAGSNITGERLRYDFTHPERIEREALDRVEAYVNAALKAGGKVSITMMSKVAAQADATIEASFWDRYPDEVKVYTVAGYDGTVYSRELCGGPHVVALEDIGGTFKIIKEESSSAGVRRIKAVLE